MKKENKKVENKFGKDSKILEFLDFLKRAFSKINIKILLLFICICVVVIFFVSVVVLVIGFFVFDIGVYW